ncbi:anthranilate synthase component I [Helicobacter bizzozeronii]|uniref:anthranilate synthase component I n=1 Tax=Helicobacter bizzozeronii TaxID=56877 RepID=UPI000CF1349C|nr:anthranilate synthase component I [Helicobacter bizzozeronii]
MISIQENAPYIAHPLAFYAPLCQPNTLLLESAQAENKHHTQSLILSQACVKIICHHDRVSMHALNANGLALLQDLAITLNTPLAGRSIHLHYPKDHTYADEFSKLQRPSPLDALRAIFTPFKGKHKHPLALFCAGLFSFDFIAYFENLPLLSVQDNSAPDFLFYVAQNLVVINHLEKSTQILGACFDPQLQAQIQAEVAHLKQLATSAPTDFNPPPHAPNKNVSTDCSDELFGQRVLKLKEELKRGEIFQAVIARSFYLECLDSLSAYHHLKAQNPSPYMFYMRTPEWVLFGASPESALKYDSSTHTAQIYPIAGTRPRGKRPDGSLDLDLDNRLELDLQSDSKERAEHVMLLDLARNDIARVAKPNTRFVNKLLKVEKYAHVMHLCSAVQGELKSGLDALHAYRSFMNAGTLSGAPKIAALKLIAALEGKRRGSYGGSMGYLGLDGSMDTCIVIRSAFVQEGRAIVQAGAGIVLESDVKAEIAESRAKAQSVIEAIQRS